MVLAMAKEEEEDDEEALSLAGLAVVECGEEKRKGRNPAENSDDFDFGSVSRDSEMCSAEEVFYQGRIMPLTGQVFHDGGRLVFRLGGAGGGASRSSSVGSSHQSSSSGSSSYGITAAGVGYGLKPPPPSQRRNLFLSQPSPSPRIRFARQEAGSFRRTQKPAGLWNIFWSGLVTPPPPEMTFHGLRFRRNQSSGGGGSSNSVKKMKNTAAFLPGCRYCTADAIETRPPPSKLVIFRRSASDGDADTLNHVNEMESPPVTAKKEASKKQLSRHRTFEWIMQLP